MLTSWQFVSLATALMYFGCFAFTTAVAQQTDDESERFKVTVVAEGLSNPCGLVERPGSTAAAGSEVFFSESGAGKVCSFRTNSPEAIADQIEGFSVGPWALDENLAVGPLGLAFLKKSKLVVGCGGSGSGQDEMLVYDLPTTTQDEPAAPIGSQRSDYVLGPIGESNRSMTGEGGFFSLVAKPDVALFATSSGDSRHGWLLKASIAKNRASDLQPFIATRETNQCETPLAATLNLVESDRGYLVVGLCGRLGAEAGEEALRDSRLAFYSPHSGRLALALDTGLQDISALAFSPTGQLYAADMAWDDEQAGGVYRLDEHLVEGKQTCRAVKICSVPRPSSLLFVDTDQLFVTAYGAASEDQNAGSILKVTGEF
ncbi:hypothetical protein [Adhaeretor mobilis]|uniref:Secreted protein n=1 Tax=Adhaeretor mobilis TaxID=1930276 RepID=A0A517MY56_9BACT|nr:hypothetical protein [Adhaeretor mobilis]QDS99786.1 hypothetical protein HG15A2_31170 [Adhaeretor mobilis]